VTTLPFSPDGKLLVSGGDGVKLWPVAGGPALATLDSSAVTSLGFSPDGKLIVSQSTNGTLRLWGIQP